jgi:hypothetical protein
MICGIGASLVEVTRRASRILLGARSTLGKNSVKMPVVALVLWRIGVDPRESTRLVTARVGRFVPGIGRL